MLAEATLKDTKWHDITHWGLRAVLGATFLVHSLKKFDPKLARLVSRYGWASTRNAITNCI